MVGPPADADASARPVPPAAAAAPPPGLTLARWLYVDAARSHEVHAGVRAGGREFVVKESAYANDDPDEILERVTRLDEPWEAPVALASLERRLSALGTYWRHDAAAPGWQRLVDAHYSAPDLRPADLGLHGGRIEFHPFRKRGAPDVVLVVVPAITAKGTRYWTAEATLERGDAERAPIRVLHPRLPVGPWRSLLAARHIELLERDHEKARAAPDAEALDRYRTLLARISGGRLNETTDTRAVPVDDLYTDYLRNLTDPRLLALHARFLTADEEAAALSGGERAIKQLVTRKRAAARTNDEQMMLTLLEASLLARDGLKVGNARVDPEVAALVRRFANYL